MVQKEVKKAKMETKVALLCCLSSWLEVWEEM